MSTDDEKHTAFLMQMKNIAKGIAAVQTKVDKAKAVCELNGSRQTLFEIRIELQGRRESAGLGDQGEKQRGDFAHLHLLSLRWIESQGQRESAGLGSSDDGSVWVDRAETSRARRRSQTQRSCMPFIVN
jgi:hypothetical protein